MILQKIQLDNHDNTLQLNIIKIKDLLRNGQVLEVLL